MWCISAVHQSPRTNTSSSRRSTDNRRARLHLVDTASRQCRTRCQRLDHSTSIRSISSSTRRTPIVIVPPRHPTITTTRLTIGRRCVAVIAVHTPMGAPFVCHRPIMAVSSRIMVRAGSRPSATIRCLPPYGSTITDVTRGTTYLVNPGQVQTGCMDRWARSSRL